MYMFYFSYLQFLAHIIFIKVLDHTLYLLKKCLRGMLGAYEKSFKIMSRRRVRYKFFVCGILPSKIAVGLPVQ